MYIQNNPEISLLYTCEIYGNYSDSKNHWNNYFTFSVEHINNEY